MIRFLVMDVDGTLTDGKIYMGQQGELIKAFNIKDGAGIVLTLPKVGIIPVIITARESDILKNRCQELKITEFHQNSQNKLESLKKILDKYSGQMSEVAYIGDDLPDVPCMENIKLAGGVVLCPSDAIPEIKAISDYISGYKAGEGAVRDCINYLLQQNNCINMNDRIQNTINLILSEDYSNKEFGEYYFSDGTKYTIQEYCTKPENECMIESHRKNVDIQYMIYGHELFDMYSTNCLTSFGEYEIVKDVEHWQGGILSTRSVLNPGSVIVVNKGQPHKGAIQFNKSERVKKVVCKLFYE